MTSAILFLSNCVMFGIFCWIKYKKGNNDVLLWQAANNKMPEMQSKTAVKEKPLENLDN